MIPEIRKPFRGRSRDTKFTTKQYWPQQRPLILNRKRLPRKETGSKTMANANPVLVRWWMARSWVVSLVNILRVAPMPILSNFHFTKRRIPQSGCRQKTDDRVLAEGQKAGFTFRHFPLCRRKRYQYPLALNSFGFQDVGVMKEVGNKFGKLLDVYIMQKMFYAHPVRSRERL